MKHNFKCIRILFAYFFYIIYIISFVNCEITSKTFKYQPEIDGKTCLSNDQLFTVTAFKKIACVNICSQSPDCKGVAYSPGNALCTGCSGLYYVSSNLVDQPGTFFYAADDIVDCGTPMVSDPHVVLGTFNGNSLYCAEVTYTCTPCTFFPRPAAAVITCQADGTWSTPDCVYGPDVGYLSNGYPIPADETGCTQYFGSSCPNMGLGGNVLRFNGQYSDDCFCDNECCNAGDCCFDSTCNG